jgi:anti-sigma regulatory factor (Ser/Thr protein kinase)
MSRPSPLHLTLDSSADVLAGVRATVRGWLATDRWSDPALSQIVLALDEALSNVIRHGYAGASGHPILLDLSPSNHPQRGDGVEIVIRDFGRQTDPERICGRPLDEPRPGGLGVHIIRCSMDECEYACAPGGGMQLTLRKFREAAPPQEGPAEHA